MKRHITLLLSLLCAAACTGSAFAEELPALPPDDAEQTPAITEDRPADPDDPDLDSGFLIEPEPELPEPAESEPEPELPEPSEPAPQTIVLTRFDTQVNFDLTAIACGDTDALHAFFRDTRDGLCGYDADGAAYDFATGEWDLSAIDLNTPGLYDATAPLLLVDAEDRPCFSLAEGVEVPVIHCRVSVQRPGRPEISACIAARGQLIFPWVLTDAQKEQRDQFTVWLKLENGAWEPLTRGISVGTDALTLYPQTCGMRQGMTCALQVEYPGGQTGILTFTYDAVPVKLGYSEGNRDGGGEDTRLPDVIQPAPGGSHSGSSHREPEPEAPSTEPELPTTEPADEIPSVPSIEQPERPESSEPSPAAPVPEQDTTDGAVLSGTRLQTLIELDEPLTLHKNGIAVSLPADALRELQPTDTDALAVTLTRASDGSPQVELQKNGEPIDPPDGMTLTTDEAETRAAQTAAPVQQRRFPLPFAAAGAAVIVAVLCLIRWRKRL